MKYSTKDQFEAAVQVVQSLPKKGTFQPSTSLLLTFYSLYKQSTLGPCNTNRPPFYDPVARSKWDSWKQLDYMTSEDAMALYVSELKKVVETMPQTKEVENFLEKIGGFYEMVDEMVPKLQENHVVNGYLNATNNLKSENISIVCSKSKQANEEEDYKFFSSIEVTQNKNLENEVNVSEGEEVGLREEGREKKQNEKQLTTKEKKNNEKIDSEKNIEEEEEYFSDTLDNLNNLSSPAKPSPLDLIQPKTGFHGNNSTSLTHNNIDNMLSSKELQHTHKNKYADINFISDNNNKLLFGKQYDQFKNKNINNNKNYEKNVENNNKEILIKVEKGLQDLKRNLNLLQSQIRIIQKKNNLSKLSTTDTFFIIFWPVLVSLVITYLTRRKK